MCFADFYFKKFASAEPLIAEKPNDNLSLIITIPCFNEPHIIKALEGLYFSLPPKGCAEVIIMLNYPANFEAKYGAAHKQQYEEIKNWISSHNGSNLRFHILFEALPPKHAGVGLARKIAMDEALRRFNFLNYARGIIAGFDADCTCSANYIEQLEYAFIDCEVNGCSVFFEHPLQGTAHEAIIYQSITSYELYLRYYVEALRSTGCPFAYHTLGSSFAVTAQAYARQGGMNKRKAGEDFYFLHKIIPAGGFIEVNTCSVYPSPRCSDRVPFGTGAAVSKISATNNTDYPVFNPDAFRVLKPFFELANNFRAVNEAEAQMILQQLHPLLQKFLQHSNFLLALKTINSNCRELKAFRNAFFNWFNGLMVLQYLNYAHENYFEKVRISEAAQILTGKIGMQNEALLLYMREKQKAQWKAQGY